MLNSTKIILLDAKSPYTSFFSCMWLSTDVKEFVVTTFERMLFKACWEEDQNQCARILRRNRETSVYKTKCKAQYIKGQFMSHLKKVNCLCPMLSSGGFTGVCSPNANDSEHTVPSSQARIYEVQLGLRMWGIYTGKIWFRIIAWANRKEVTGWGKVGAGKQAVDTSDPHGGHGYVRVVDPALFRGEEGEPWIVEINCCVLGGFLPSLSFLSARLLSHTSV
jgi:hypothetical protein